MNSSATTLPPYKQMRTELLCKLAQKSCLHPHYFSRYMATEIMNSARCPSGEEKIKYVMRVLNPSKGDVGLQL